MWIWPLFLFLCSKMSLWPCPHSTIYGASVDNLPSIPMHVCRIRCRSVVKGVVAARTLLPSSEEAQLNYVMQSTITHQCSRLLFAKAQIQLGSSRHASSLLETFDVSSPCIILPLSRLSNSTARHARYDWLDTSNVSRRVETWRDKPSGILALQEDFRSAFTAQSWSWLIVSSVRSDYHDISVISCSLAFATRRVQWIRTILH